MMFAENKCHSVILAHLSKKQNELDSSNSVGKNKSKGEEDRRKFPRLSQQTQIRPLHSKSL